MAINRAEAIRHRQQALLRQAKRGRDYAAELKQQIALTMGDEALWHREYPFHGERRWRLDLANVSRKLAVEIEGVTFTKGDYRMGGRHASITGFSRDCEKYAALAIAGWRLIRVLPKHVKDGTALKWIEQALKS